jgi:hypothetical protein
VNQRDWERDLELRQRNIVFPDTVQNQGRFYRNILRTGMPLSAAQRIGIIVVAVSCLISSALMFAGAIAEGRAGGVSLMLSLPLAAIALLPFALSWMLFKRAIFVPAAKQLHERKNLWHPHRF